MTKHRSLPFAAAAALLAAGLSPSCSTQDDDPMGSGPESTSVSIGSTGKVEVSERWLLFQADEFTTGPGGSDLNFDTDRNDSVATLVDMTTKSEVNLAVAVQDFAILGTGASAQVYLVVKESRDGRDWSKDGLLDDLVLLRVKASGASFFGIKYVADVSATSSKALVVTGSRLWFVEVPPAGDPLTLGQTAINRIDLASPGVPKRANHLVVVPGTSTALVEVLASPSLLGADEGLVLFTMDETVEEPFGGGPPGVNLNGSAAGTVDNDSMDAHVLGALDATQLNPVAFSFGYAVAAGDAPVRARAVGVSDWLVAFLVSEADQGGTNFNHSLNSPDLPGGWLPMQCSVEDSDSNDDVLHWVQTQAFLANAVTNRPVNTGLAGRLRVLAVQSGAKRFVATLSPEGKASCDLNADMDIGDEVLRWAPVGPGTAFVTDPASLLAVESVPGGVQGVSDLDGRFLAVISEADNKLELNGDQSGEPGYRSDELVAWLDPAAVTRAWTFDHSSAAGVQAVGTDWMAERPARDRLLVTLQESVLGGSINSSDDDTLDSAATLALFDSGELDFPGPAIATQAGNAGIVMVGGLAFLRVSESADNRDWNQDGDLSDFVLFRTDAPTIQDTTYLGVLNNLSRPSVEVGGSLGAAFLTNETMAGSDLNGDGDTADHVLRWLRID